MHNLKIHNSFSGKKEDFIPLDKNHIKIYACGPTVYNFAHIGNARMAVVFDTFVRLLRHTYPKVTYVSNITDIDDKIITAAREQKLPISGVYAVRCRLGEKLLKGIANMGTRPTVGGTLPVLEVHLFDFYQQIYSQRLEVEFKHKIRKEKKFENLDMLKSQINKDIALAKTLLQD